MCFFVKNLGGGGQTDKNLDASKLQKTPSKNLQKVPIKM
jgi:hypothetical protein